MTDENKNQKLIGENVGFERIRRITGYLVGGLDRFNNAKRVEVNDRVSHMKMNGSMPSISVRERPKIDQTLLTRLWILEESFLLPGSHCMTYKRMDTIYAKLNFDLKDIETRLDILQGVAKHQEQMTERQIQFWLDTVRYDGEIDLDKEPSRDKYPDTHETLSKGMYERMMDATEAADRVNSSAAVKYNELIKDGRYVIDREQ